MSDENKPVDPTPDGPSAKSKKSPAAKAPRSPVERAIVWGVIGVLLIVGAIQGTAAFGFKNSVSEVRDALKRAEAGSKGEVLDLKTAEKAMTGFWSKSEFKKVGGTRFVVYKWPGVYTSYTLLLNVSIDETNPMVISYETNTDTSQHKQMMTELVEEMSAAADESDAPASDMTSGPGGFDPHQGPGGSNAGTSQSIDWESLDKDKDGKISKEEAPESMLRFFDRIDANSDGFIDDEEREEMQRRRAARQESGGAGGPGARPQRPGQPDADPKSESDPKSDSKPDPESSATTTPEKPASQP